MQDRAEPNSTDHAGDEHLAVKKAYADYMTAAAEHGHESAEAMAARIRWGHLSRRRAVSLAR